MHILNNHTLCVIPESADSNDISTAGGFVGRPRSAAGAWTVDGLVSHRMAEGSPVMAVVETAPYYVWIKQEMGMELIEFYKD